MFSKLLLAPVAIPLILSSLTLTSSVSAYVAKRATVCNGFPEFCARSYANVTVVGAHDSYAVGTNNLATNQDYDIPQQLKDGIRMLQVQAHNQTDGVHLCHTSCFLYDGGTFQAYLGKVKTFMDANPNEVVTLLIVNSDGVSPSTYASIYQSVGLDTLSYVPPSASMAKEDWPTLGAMIDSGKRLVTFMDAGADPTQAPYIIDEFSNAWETAFDVTDPTFDCNVNRTHGDPSTQLYIINHFLDMPVNVIASTIAPNKGALNVTNGVSGPGSLGQQVSDCVLDQGRPPNFMLVDFYEYGGGSVFQVAANINGVQYNPTSPIATPLPDTTNGTSPSSAAVPMTVGGASRGFGLGAVLIAGATLGAWTVLI